MKFLRTSVFLLAATTGLAGPASALTIVDDMNTAPSSTPGVTNNFPWTSVIFGGTAMTSNAGIMAMDTAAYVGVWFGNGSMIGYYPGWSLGDAASGNYFSLTMRLDQNSADWSFYFYDLNGYGAAITFNPAGGYYSPMQSGFQYSWADANHQWQSTFVAADLSSGFHTFETLLKNGNVDYALDGQLLFSGFAGQAGAANLLVIGDGSGSTGTGTGRMSIDRVVFDTAPTISHLASVPVPAAAWLFGAGLLGLVGVARRRRV